MTLDLAVIGMTFLLILPAVLLGGWLQHRVPLWRIRIVSGVVRTALATWTAVEFIRA